MRQEDLKHDIRIVENGEALVPIGFGTRYPEIAVDPIYCGIHMSSPYLVGELGGALFAQFVRKNVAERLAKAARLLPRGLILLVWDAYRQKKTQEALYQSRYARTRTAHPDWDEARLQTDVSRFVALPSDDPQSPSPHLTGGAIDMTLARMPLRNWFGFRARSVMAKALGPLGSQRTSMGWKFSYLLHTQIAQMVRFSAMPLPMGTRFDEVNEKTATYYFEKKLGPVGGDTMRVSEWTAVRNWRKTLRERMIAAGFMWYTEEWWHGEYGTRMCAELVNVPTACYGPAALSAENWQWEYMRRVAYHLNLPKGVPWPLPPFPAMAPFIGYAQFFRRWFARRGGVRFTIHPIAKKI